MGLQRSRWSSDSLQDGKKGMIEQKCPMHVEPTLVRHYDYLHDPRIAYDFWQMCAGMADQPEIFWSPAYGGYWVVTGAEAFEEGTSRTDLFSSVDMGPPPVAQPFNMIPLNLDPPEHTKYRREMMARMFSVRALGNLEGEVTEICRAIIAEFINKGACDFLAAFARRLPVDLFLSLMGEPPARREAFLYWVEKVFGSTNPDEARESFVLANRFTEEWLDVQLRLRSNQGRLFRALREFKVDGKDLTRAEMHLLTMMLFVGGLDTVVSQLTHFMKFFAENPAHRQILIDHPERISDAVEELLRRFGIAPAYRRVAKDEVFRGVHFKKGEVVMFSTPFANLDRRVFGSPLEVDFDRPNARSHWAFGNGPHFCPGAYLARTELRIALKELLPRTPNLRLAAGAKPRMCTTGTYRLTSLPIEWDVTVARNA
jgi:cytochrome P450